VLEDGSNSEHSILSYVGVTMFETGASGGQEGFNKFSFPKFAQESQGIAPNVFVGMLEIISDAVASIISVSFFKRTFQGALTRLKSSPASTSRWHRVLDIFHSRNTIAF
jgi:hypothetical protein